MLRLKQHCYAFWLMLVGLFALTACEVEIHDNDEGYRYTREVIVGQWRVQEALPRVGSFIPYTPGSTLAFEDYGRFGARYYYNGERESGKWHMLRHSDGQPYVRIELPLATGRTTVLYANIESIRDNYLRLDVEDRDERSYYTLILTRIY